VYLSFNDQDAAVELLDIKEHEAPLQLMSLQLLQEQLDQHDQTFSKLIGYINGVSSVKQISVLSKIHIDKVKVYLQNLKSQGLVRILSRFS